MNPFNHRHPMIGIHLDLKGVMFRPNYLPRLLADLAGQGVNTVLVEYEDVFPFRSVNVADDSSTVWSRAVLRRFLADAERLGIEVIPLQQCLGHLEYVFRWQRYRRFAENRRYPSTLCLSQPAGRALVRGTLEEIFDAHPAGRYVHLGMDEAHALATCPRCRRKGDILTVFLEYLRELCDLCDAHGKTPIIWSDMLEDHFRPDVFADIRHRVILAPWEYNRHDRVDPMSRIGGWRVSRQWVDEPGNPAAPAISDGTRFVEDLPPGLQRVLAPYRRGRGFKPLFVADLWTRLGFRIVGPSRLRVSSDGPVMPAANDARNNLATWVGAVKRTRQLGVIATSWERGTTFCPPNFNFDLNWPQITFLARALGAKPKPFWPGIPPATVERIVTTLGRCRRDWRLESVIADEMAKLAPRVKAHRFEWDSLRLMARVLAWHRRAEFAQAEIDYFDPAARPTEDEWQRRLDDQAGVLRDAVRLRREVTRHFGRRYHGEAFREWVRALFDLPERRVRECRVIARRKRSLARRRYAR
ncbi:family 20 glycosylhydrolase [bacterium]|nr:family 20 glycosylhydrolase [bacterium]